MPTTDQLRLNNCIQAELTTLSVFVEVAVPANADAVTAARIRVGAGTVRVTRRIGRIGSICVAKTKLL